MASHRRKGLRRALAVALVAAIAAPASGWAKEGGAAPGTAPAASEGPSWAWGPSVLFYILPGETNYLQPTLTADRGALHLEARYNYEDRETGSVFVGWNLSFGEELKLGLTPMLGGVFGRTNGIAPALTLTLEWGPLALWSQCEYVFDLEDSSGNFFYAWSELSVSIVDWLRAGLALQRTRVFQANTEIQGGPLLGVSFWKLSATAYLFAPGQEDQFVAVSVAGSF